MSMVADAVRQIQIAADRLFAQHKYSNGYTSIGDSEIAEANIAIQVAAAFIHANFHVWAEVPFKKGDNTQCLHLDLLVDLAPKDPNHASLLTVEAKRIGFGENDKKVEEIADDYERIRSWQTSDETQIPLFYGVAHAVEWFYGALIAVLPEPCDKDGLPQNTLFSEWWKSLIAPPDGYSAVGLKRLGDVLQEAVVRDYQKAQYWDGFDEVHPVGRRMCVCYAVFDFGPGPGSLHTATHEAAHAVVARRLDIPVRALILSGDGGMRGGAVCDWESLRGVLPNRETCIRGFAVAFAGALQEALNDEGEADFYEILNRLPTDSGAVIQARERLRQWENLASTADTEAESLEGFRLAKQIISEEYARIARLGADLLRLRYMDEQAILSWFAEDDRTADENDIQSL